MSSYSVNLHLACLVDVYPKGCSKPFLKANSKATAANAKLRTLSPAASAACMRQQSSQTAWCVLLKQSQAACTHSACFSHSAWHSCENSIYHDHEAAAQCISHCSYVAIEMNTFSNCACSGKECVKSVTEWGRALCHMNSWWATCALRHGMSAHT